MSSLETSTFEIIAKTLYGLEDVLAEEIAELGGQDIEKLNRGVKFKGDTALLYKANYYLRTAIKILKPLKHFTAKNEVDLYKGIDEIEWASFFKRGDTLYIEPVVNSEHFNHSQFVAQKTKDAIVDQLRKTTGRRPSIDSKSPTCKLNVHIANDMCTISLDSSGDSLHKRGYRIDGHIAPINEVLAAGLIRTSGWKADKDFCDLMCGSGTLLVEAALYAYNIAPGIFRKEFAFEQWNDFDQDLFDKICDDIPEKKFEHKIYGCDFSPKAVSLAKANISQAFLQKRIDVEIKSMFNMRPRNASGIMIINPPYGERLKPKDIEYLYGKIGDKLKTDFHGFDAWVISSNKDALKQIGLRTSRRLVFFNGDLECKFHKFELYRGTKKNKTYDKQKNYTQKIKFHKN